MHLKEELEQRGYLHQRTHDEVFDIFDKGGKKFYLGVDLSADSMTIGNFVALMMAIRIMMKGNTGYLLVGGATSTIGNPSGKDNERPILSDEQLRHNEAAIGKQFGVLCKNIEAISGSKLTYKIVNNKDFFTHMNVLDYLKEVGRYITVNRMLGKDIVKKRVEDPDKYISYAEFSYMLIMGYDFYHLFTEEDVIMEVGGSDERDGIITGIELIGKKTEGTAYGITNKLIVDSSGRKFGKSEGNALRLDPEKNSPYKIYQYFMNTADEDIGRYLKLFTVLSFDEIQEIATQHANNPAERFGQKRLAHFVTEIIFGTKAALQSELITSILFGPEDTLTTLQKLNTEDIDALHKATGGQEITEKSIRIADACTLSGLTESNGTAKKLLKEGILFCNEQKIQDSSLEITKEDSIHGLVLLRKGKKTRSSFRFV